MLSGFEKDVSEDQRIRTLLKESDGFAVEFYAAMCNLIWMSPGKSDFAASFREASEVVARLRENGEDYMTFYLSGGEGRVTQRVENELKRLGWLWRKYEDRDFEKHT